jgi:pilus assembly protein Flp/PilA
MCQGGPSGEEAVTLLKGNKGKYRALVTDINLVGRIDGSEVARLAREIDPAFRRSQQHSPDQAVCASAACYRRFPASQCWHTDNVMPPWRPLFHLARPNPESLSSFFIKSRQQNLKLSGCGSLNLRFSNVCLRCWPAASTTPMEAELKRILKQFLSNESGATAIEYGLIAAGISLAIIAVVNGLGSNLNDKYTTINNSLK